MVARDERVATALPVSGRAVRYETVNRIVVGLCADPAELAEFRNATLAIVFGSGAALHVYELDALIANRFH